MRRSLSTGPANGLDAATAQRLFERLDRLVAALESTARAAAPASETAAGAPARTLVADANADLIARIDALEHELIRLRDRPGINTPPIARTSEPPPLERAAVDQCAAQLSVQDEPLRQETRRSLFHLTQQQVLQRFGTPTWTYIADGGHVGWNWDTGKASFVVIFIDGRVAVID